MIICPNKNAKEWKSLVAAIGEDKATLAFFRNGNEIPSVAKAESLLTYRGILKTLDTIPTLSEETVMATLSARGLIGEDSMEKDGKTWYRISDVADIAHKLGEFSEQFPVLEYSNDLVTIDKEMLETWNRMSFNYAQAAGTPTEMAKNFLKRIGVSVVSRNNIVKEYGVNAIADFAQRMVLVQSGRENVALTEEAMHFFIDMLPQDDSVLTEALDKIRTTKTYKDIFEQYKNNPNYRTKDNQINFEKLKKEALAKELAAGLTTPKADFITRLIKKIMDWIKGLKLQKDPVDILREMFMSEQINNLNLNIKSSEIYNQMTDQQREFYESQNLNETQKATLQKILAINANMEFDEEQHMLVRADASSPDVYTMTVLDKEGNKTVKQVRGYKVTSVTKSLGSDFFSELEDPDVIEQLIQKYESEFKSLIDYTKNLDDKSVAKNIVDIVVDKLSKNELTREQLEDMGGKKLTDLLFMASENMRKTMFGTAMHKIVELIIKEEGVDFDDMGAEVDELMKNVYGMMDKKTLNNLIFGRGGIAEVINDLRKDGSVLMSEIVVGNGKLGGVVDIVRIRPDGKVEIYDFKNKYLRKRTDNKPTLEAEFQAVINITSNIGVKDEPGTLNELKMKRRRLVDKYSQQLSLYKKILMEQGLDVGDTTIIGVPYMINETTNKIDKVKVHMLAPSAFAEKLGNYMFPNLDLSKDATRDFTELTPDERLKLLDKIGKNKLKEAFVKSLGRLDQLSRFYSKNKEAKKIFDLLTDNRTKTNRLRLQASMLKGTLDNIGEDDDLANIATIQKNFLELLDSSVPIISIINKEFEELKNSEPTDSKASSQRLSELMKMRDFLIGYQTMFEELLSYMGTTDNENSIVKMLNGMIGVISSIRKDYVATISPVITKVLGDTFTSELVDNIKREYMEMIIAANQRGDKKLEEKLRKEMADLPDEKVIRETLSGNKGDVGWFFGKLVATISNPDIVLAGTAKKLKATLDRVRLMNKDLRDRTDVEYSKRADVFGRGLDQKKMNESLVYISTVYNAYSGEEMQQMFFKSEFDEKLYYDYNKLLKVYNDAVKEKDKDQIKIAKKALKDFENKFFESEFTEEYYKLTAPLDQEVSYQGKQMTIREITGHIFDDMRAVTARYSREDVAAGNMSDDDLKIVQGLWEQYFGLKEKRDKNNKPKTGDALKIADALEAYEKNQKQLYDDFTDMEMYTKINEKKKLELGENSAEYKKWLEMNTVVSVTDEYFDKMQQLMDEKAAIQNNPEAERLAEISRELRLLTKPYKDVDGIVKAQNMPADKLEKMKMLEAERKELMDTVDVISLNGYTPEEQRELRELKFLRNNGKPYSKRRMDAIEDTAEARVNERIASDPTYGEKIKRLKEINGELSRMRTMETSKYYEIELEKQLDLFAEAVGKSVNEVMEDSDLYQQFQDSDWFKQNHNITFTVLYEDAEGNQTGERQVEPLYAWKRFQPDEQYIVRKPGHHFRRRVMNDSYTNASGRIVMLRNTDNRDIQNRYKPKSNEEYKLKNGVDHPYLNKEYVALKNKVDNKMATVAERVDFENLLFITNEMIKSQEDIELSQRLGLAVPFMEKTLTERTIESKGDNLKQGAQSKFSSLKEGVQRLFKRTDQDVDQQGIGSTSVSTLNRLATVDNDQVKYVPVRFSRKGKADNASYNVWSGFLNYVGSINRKKELEKELAFINGLEEVLSETQNQPKSEANNLVINNVFKKYLPELEQKINEGGNTRLEVLRSFINSVMYNEEYFKGYDILGVNTQKTISQLMTLTSYTTLGIAPFNWTVNWMSGNVQNMVEASGGQYFTMKQFMKDKSLLYNGDATHGSVIKDMMADYGKLGNKSFWGQIIEVFDPIQGDFENEFGEKTNFSKYKNIFDLGIFGGKIWGEWEIQMSAFLSFIKNNKLYNGKIIDKETFITQKLGNIEDMTLEEISQKKLEALQEFDKLDVSLIDIMELDKKGKLVVKDQYKDAFELGSQQFSDVVAKLHAMQKKLNGSYAKFDKTFAEKTSLGRMMFFFRKYFIPLGLNRWGKRRVNYESMSVEEGFYLTFMRTMLKDLAQLKLKVLFNWSNYSDFEKRAIKKTLADAAFIMTMFALYGLVLGYDPDDPDRLKKLRQKSYGHQASVFLLLKLRSETEQFMPGYGIQEVKRIYSNPSLILSEITQYINIGYLVMEQGLDILPGVDREKQLYYQRDVDSSGLKDEGDSKLLAEGVKAIFGYSGKTFNPVDAVKGYEYTQRPK